MNTLTDPDDTAGWAQAWLDALIRSPWAYWFPLGPAPWFGPSEPRSSRRAAATRRTSRGARR